MRRKTRSTKRKRNGGASMGNNKRRRIGARPASSARVSTASRRTMAAGIPRGVKLVGFPAAIRQKQPYLTVYKALTRTLATASAPWEHRFRLNSTFDPDYETGGTQPFGRDQMAALYARYIVNKCSWTYKLTEFTGTTGALVAYGYYITTDGVNILNKTSTFQANMRNLMQKKYRAKWAYRDIDAGTYTPAPTLSGHIDPRVLDPEDSVSSAAALTGLDPDSVAIIHFFCICDIIADSLPLTPVIRMNYDTSYFEPLPLPQS